MPIAPIPSSAKRRPRKGECTSGITAIEICNEIGITRILKSVPKPGLSRNGIHKKRTARLISPVTNPSGKLVLKEIPCARTVHGELPNND
jgi:hypothetical protein